ncbi:MAG: phosphoenolpyruvate--protein phosphotransferase [Desulfitobacteriaceae bacterium]
MKRNEQVMSMKYIRGIAASNGIAITKALLVQERWEIPNRTDIDVDQEILRFKDAIQKSLAELQQVYEETKSKLGKDKARIFEAHMLILQDSEWVKSVVDKIQSETINAEAALDQSVKQYIDIFELMENEYLKERIADIKDVGQRVMSHLLGISYSASQITEPVVIIAHDLTPSYTVQLSREYVQGFATNIGGRTSHTAIVARSMEIPAVVGLQDITAQVENGQVVIIDGIDGKVIVNPSSEVIAQYEQKRREFFKGKGSNALLVNEPTITEDGHQVELTANIGTPEDLDSCLRNGAEGIGLFRTEFLYMNRKKLPSEDEQFLAYKAVAEGMKGKPVTIRTLDIGGDKELPYLNLEKEMNPFLGYRAIRLCLDQQEIFQTQIRAILRASHYGKVKMMYPMISSLSEVRQANALVAQVKEELDTRNIPYNHEMEVGIMVEIPASALIADVMAKEVDFFSIGTNDLIQYTMAVDRLNEKISYLYQPYHPAVLRIIQMVIDAAHRQNRRVAMCGEMAGDPLAAPILLGLGLDEFSMSAPSLLGLRQLLRGLNFQEMRVVAQEALKLDSQEEIKKLIKNSVQGKVPVGLIYS